MENLQIAPEQYNWIALLKQSQSENDIQVNSSFAILFTQQNECRNSCLSSTLTVIPQSSWGPIQLPLVKKIKRLWDIKFCRKFLSECHMQQVYVKVKQI